MRPCRGLQHPAARQARRGAARAAGAALCVVALAGGAACSPRAVVTTVATSAVSTAAGAASTVAGAAASVATQATAAMGSAGASAAFPGVASAGGTGPLEAPGSTSRGLGALEVVQSGTAESMRAREPQNRSTSPQVIADTSEALESCIRSMFDMRGLTALLGAAGFDVRRTAGEAGAEADAQRGDVSVNLSTPLGLCLVSGNDLGFEVTKALTERTLAKMTGARLELARVGASCGSAAAPSPGGIVQIDIVPLELGAGCDPDTAVQILVTAGEAFL